MQKTGSITSSPPRSSTNTSINTEGKRHTRLKETQFTYRYGQKLHSFEPEKAPYPVSYDKEILELEHLDGQLVKYLRQGSVSFIDFPEGERPQRCLDLGCGTGAWIIEAAKEWQTTEFVGFDLVDIQLKIFDPSLEERIQWVFGNFLTTKLPFEDDEFDHIHVQSISLGVPENKWDVLFDEICRVLRPGGSVEMIEDDIIFPSLPRWFTAPMRAKPRRSTSVHLPEGSVRGSISSSFESTSSTLNHDHALLESLHKSVFEHRFINMKPSALLPSYFTTYFRQVTLGPVLSFFLPPLPPLQPLSPQITTAYAVGPLGLELEQRASVISNSTSNTRPISVSFSSSTSGSSQGSRDKSHPSAPKLADALSSAVISDSDDNYEDIPSPPPRELYALEANGLADKTTPKVPLVTNERLDSLNERSLAMHLFRAYNYVLGCQDALWEELKDRLRNRKEELEPFGWDDEEEFEEVHNRKKFERLLERYRSDMQSRVSLWCSLHELGWPQPAREPLSKAELIEEERMREGMREALSEARRTASFEDQQLPCRSIRVLVGSKP
ncbi:hypothetical protein C8J55DRAFT_453032 [Lentinula edodes]|uniref:Methyltransferase domain-containing protein n=1 Tax=Lentinula lateritia TaxID=40482 RepID=A0A9W9DUU3_9AGAR|nr:hypothetical protein C8J55DRAFT_453032 [Lentinula edodes]